MTEQNDFGEGFPPKSIAFVGVSRTNHFQHPGYTGSKLIRILQEGGFEGRLYPVNPKATEIDGLKAYPTVSAIPETVDLVNITVPAPAVPGVLEDCARARPRNVQICTSGFGETGGAEGKALDAQILEIASRTGLRIIGPNCMGFHVPSARIQMFENVPMEPGPVAFLSQSGGHARVFILHASHKGVGLSKVISYGNALLTDEADLVEYLATDPDTRVVCMYLEGVKKGRRLMELVQAVSPTKPVVIWKGGLSAPGARAAASHTASLAGERQIWDAFFKQTGAIPVGSIEEMVDVALLLLHLKPLPQGNRVTVLGGGGGDTVAAGDACAEAGLEVPPLSPQTRSELLSYVYLVNQGIGNPLDLPIVFYDMNNLRRTLRTLADDPLLDAIMIRMGSEFFVMDQLFPSRSQYAEAIRDVAEHEMGRKPVMVAITDETSVEPAEKHARAFREAGVPALGSLRRVCHALSRVSAYQRYLTSIGAEVR
ncbi:MAG: hypothetical protein FJZ95_01680 [Chloroflexi bacterium]|nr:hypothetical protein [Chloroflexota bacterium]